MNKKITVDRIYNHYRINIPINIILLKPYGAQLTHNGYWVTLCNSNGNEAYFQFTFYKIADRF